MANLVTFSMQAHLQLCPKQAYYTLDYLKADYDGMNKHIALATGHYPLHGYNEAVYPGRIRNY